ncbi:hypothetical protein SEUCBS140593_010690 [Sporothrix eucalyptigena]|uniref:Uncharacterized protein n=1 Tax=Sporothrix eucalyptigena TaxID=1812306 RepID=A0ABP0D3R7_9PEZI
MASLGKLSNSMISITNENTLALLNVNIDFALVRCDPSPEYSKVGSALTLKRKHEAENGALHSIACKLGFLFHEMLPNTPKLHRAYGTRISEILARPGINPEGTKNDGPFRDFVGADCTSIWAAATSGPASISMLFLACMLARAWDAKTTTSIWVELIDERKKQIWAQVDANKIVHPHSLAASRQDLSRADLASWDASVRSWLRRADAAMVSRATQLQLVAKNLSIPYWSAGSTFERVMMNWTRSMEMVEKLLSNIPQEASTRAVLVAISSWHLYPDLLVFQEKARKIPFTDELFPTSGILSTGLEYKGPVDNVTQWSLSLSHFRYYGHPVLVQSENNQDRVPARKLWVAALGVIFRQWEVSYSKFDDAVAWFRVLGNVLRRSNKADCAELSWLMHLCNAAATVVGAAGELNDGGLIKYGWRRAKPFLGHDHVAMRNPFFGLRNPYVVTSLTKSSEIDCGIEYLRGIALHIGLRPNEAVHKVEYRHPSLIARSSKKRKAPMDEATPNKGYTTSTINHASDAIGCFRLMSRACIPPVEWLMSLRALELVTCLYDAFDAATVSLRILDRSILKANWLPDFFRDIYNLNSITTTPVATYLAKMRLAETFSCIALFESGHLDIAPDQMNQVLALCSEDSIFVASVMLCDPGTKPSNNVQVRHLIGNVGHSGMVLMVSPIAPRIRAVGHNPELVAHRPYDDDKKDSFGGTSLHLSFTTWKMPLDWEDTGAIDQSIFIVESVVSVQDNGQWVADIDVLDMVENYPDIVEEFLCDQDCDTASPESTQDIVSIDSWEELLDPPPCAAVFRAVDNWPARLAAVCIIVQQSKGHCAAIIQGGKLCLSCLRSLYSDPEPHLPDLIIN